MPFGVQLPVKPFTAVGLDSISHKESDVSVLFFFQKSTIQHGILTLVSDKSPFNITGSFSLPYDIVNKKNRLV
jgi:hypothetical protein